MPTTPSHPLRGVHTVLFAHAHPDDETLASGALMAEFAARGLHVALLTSSRGERGEVVAGPLSALEGTPALSETRERELAEATTLLGVEAHAWLGSPPAREPGRPARRYRDSGMRWVRPGLAGPAADPGPDSLCSAELREVVSDVCALLAAWSPQLVISYDSGGGYGHPDHVRTREAALTAARARGIRFAELVTEPGEGVTWFGGEGWMPLVTSALTCHASQLTVDGDQVVHSGGQREPIATGVGLRVIEG